MDRHIRLAALAAPALSFGAIRAPRETRNGRGTLAPMESDPTRARRPPLVVRYHTVRVSVTRGPDKGKHVDLAGSPIRVGTAPENDLVLSDDTVSRNHCEAELGSFGIRVRDLGSKNGVFLGGARIWDAAASPPVVIRLGDTELSMKPTRDVVEKEQASESRFGLLLGESARMRELFAVLERVASTDYTLLIEGETGTGKDLVAESVHQESARRAAEFVVFDCGATAANLIESELFGHERGAFTGAVAARAGLFEQAAGGTLFLDELGELPKELQPKLLRALEQREVRRVGGSRFLPVDVRVIAATNRNLAHEVRQGNFRQDLYYRLAAAHVHVPPLRDRMEDLVPLVRHFLAREGAGKSAEDIPEQVWEMFRAHRWPGNVRELRNAVQRLAMSFDVSLSRFSAQANAPHERSFERPDGSFVSLQEARRESGDDFEAAYVRAVLAKTGGNATRAADLAEVSRQLLQRLIKKHAIR